VAEHSRTRTLRFELTYDEQATWGECPACHAGHGERCHSEVGPCIGQTIDGRRPADGVHIGRLRAAPRFVELRPVTVEQEVGGG
jgi:hypothetical protein